MPEMGAAETKITFALIRQTFGYQRRQVRLTYDDLMSLTGIGSRSTVRAGIKKVLKRGFFVRDASRLTWRSTVRLLEPGTNATLRGGRLRGEGRPGTVLKRETGRRAAADGPSGKPAPADAGRLPRPTRGTGTQHAAGDNPALPDSLDTAEFRESWGGYLAHRQELGHPLTVSSARMNLGRLETVGYDEALARIRRTVERNWRYLFYQGDERNYGAARRLEQDRPADEAWRIVCDLSARGRLAELPPGAVRNAARRIGEERLYRMKPEERHWVKREFAEALRRENKARSGHVTRG
jgi:hypothetical protein